MRAGLGHVLAVVGILSLIACPAGEQTTTTVASPDALVAEIDGMVAEALANGPTAAISIAVARGPEIIVAKGYGLADVENEVAATADTVYRLGSLTKQFTSVAVMRLVEAGLINLDDEITRCLADFPTQGHTVRVRHLLNHTSGIKSYTGLGEEFWSKSRLDLSHEELLELIADEPFDFAPGTAYAYNNSGYYLLGMIIEEVTGQSYADHLRETIFEPLGLDATYYCSNEPIIPHRASGYARHEGELVNAGILSMTSPYAAGALCSTVLDLVTWQRALHSGALLEAATYARMITPETLADGSPLSYGYGLGIGEMEGHAKIMHGGGINGFTTALAYYPDDDLSTVVLTNTEGANPGGLERRITRAVLGIPEPEVADLPIPRAEIDRSVGDYALEDLPIEVFEDDGRLMLGIGDDDAFRLLYQGEHRYVASVDQEMGITFAAEDDAARQLVISQEGSEFIAIRIQ
jgi:CubicO group peptidase (beta-lactamase class C family)